MNRVLKWWQVAVAAVVVTQFFAVTQVQAATYTFDPASRDSSAPAIDTIDVLAGDTLNFSLAVNSENALGTFALDIYADPGKAPGAWLGSITLFFLIPPLPTDTAHYGSITFPSPGGPEYVYFDPAQSNDWYFTASSAGKLYLYVTTELNIDANPDTPAVAVLGLDIVPAPSEVPLPGTLPLFAAGLGVVGLMARRRSNKHKASSVMAA